MLPKPYLFGIHADPPPAVVWLYRALPFIAILVAYHIASSAYLAENPNGKVFPSYVMMFERMRDLATVLDTRTGTYLLWSDTGASLMRFAIGVVMASLVGLLLGMNMALFPGLRHMSLPFVTSISNIPTTALMPILLVIFGIDDFAKIALIFLGVVFTISRDMYTTTKELPKELLVKARTLGTTQFGLAYRVVLPMLMPRLIEATRVALGPAWIFLIVGEGIAATEGLGYRIFLVRRYFDMAAIIPYVAWITLIAFTLDRFLVFVCAKAYPWKK